MSRDLKNHKQEKLQGRDFVKSLLKDSISFSLYVLAKAINKYLCTAYNSKYFALLGNKMNVPYSTNLI